MAGAWTAQRLKKEQPYILCENIESRKLVVQKLVDMGFHKFGSMGEEDLAITIDEDNRFIAFPITAAIRTITVIDFLTQSPQITQPELIKLKKQLLEIADKERGEAFLIDELETDNYNAITAYIAGHRQSATDIADLIINSEI